MKERISRWWASRQQTTDDVIAYYAQPGAALPARTPLTTSQHILHLILTVLTGGLWGIVWLIAAMRGNAPRR